MSLKRWTAMAVENQRPSWDEYFMDITCLVAKRATCLRRAVGAVIVKDRRVLATGYNGAPSNVRHCAEVGCMREQMKVPSGELPVRPAAAPSCTTEMRSRS